MAPVALLLAGALAWAGSADAALMTGIVALEHGDVPRALERLEAAMADPAQLGPRHEMKGWKALAEARLRAARLEGGPAGVRRLQLGALEAAGRCADDERYGAGCQQVQERSAIGLLNAVLSGEEAAAPDDCVAALVTLWPASWLGGFAQAHRALDTKDRPGAARGFDAAATQLLAGAPPSRPLEIVGLMAADRALNTAQMSGPDAAQAELEAFAAALRARPHAAGQDITAALGDATAMIATVAEALRALEAAATAADAPTATRIEWASMLDQMGRFDAATAAWRAAAEGDPASFEAAYFWGVHHYNRGAALQDADPGAARAQLQAARGPLEAAAQLKPADAALRSTLVTVCAVTGDLPCMRRYDTPAD